MYFSLVDRVVEIQPGQRISAVKQLAPGESYLRDHFPGFPVMPGVLMLEAMYQACAWLLLCTDDFQTDVARLRETRNVKFGSFVKPGDVLLITAEIVKRDVPLTTLRTQGKVGDTPAASARLLLDQNCNTSPNDDDLNSVTRCQTELREIFDRLYKPFPSTNRKTMGG